MNVNDSRSIEASQIDLLAHDEAQDLFLVELNRTVDLLRTLAATEWVLPTDCPAWDVHRLYLHVLGALESGASIREFVHQLRASARYRRKHGGPMEAALSHVQVADRQHLSATEVLDRLEATGVAASRRRRRLPGPIRAIRITADPQDDKWSLGYLNDTIYLRDLWMHRVDAARATGRTVVVTPEHDGRIVADVVAEWARRHGQPFRLELTGDAGGGYVQGAGGETISLDAVEYCRILTGRGAATGLLTTPVPF